MVSTEVARASLMAMAAVWERLANQQNQQPAAQQQQQIQPDDDKKK
jgi:hypothetical protein